MSENFNNEHRPDAAPTRYAAEWRTIVAQAPLLFEVTSGSMAPTFRAGEHVFIRPLRDGEPRPGQVLAYAVPRAYAVCRADVGGTLFAHRYLGSGVCRGDNTLEKDPPVERENMIGIVTGVKRNEKVVPIRERMPLGTHIHRLRLWFRRFRHAVKNIAKKP